jgi:hypothetical protein
MKPFSFRHIVLLCVLYYTKRIFPEADITGREGADERVIYPPPRTFTFFKWFES